MNLTTYRPTAAGLPGLDRYPRLAIEDGCVPQLVANVDEETQAEALVHLMAQAYPGKTWSA